MVGAVGYAKEACTVDIWDAISKYAKMSQVVTQATIHHQVSYDDDVCLGSMGTFFGSAAELFAHAWQARLDCVSSEKRGQCLIDIIDATASFAESAHILMISAPYCPGDLQQDVMQEVSGRFPRVMQIFMDTQMKAFKATALGANSSFSAADLLTDMVPVIDLARAGMIMAFNATRLAGGGNVPGFEYLEHAFRVL